jgi:hypothetical protein
MLSDDADSGTSKGVEMQQLLDELKAAQDKIRTLEVSSLKSCFSPIKLKISKLAHPHRNNQKKALILIHSIFRKNKDNLNLKNIQSFTLHRANKHLRTAKVRSP